MEPKKALWVAILVLSLILLSNYLARGATNIVEAENMTPTGQTNKAVTDGWGLLGVAQLSAPVTFISTSAKLDIIAKGSYAGGGWPHMEVKIAGVLYDTITVDSATWKTFTVQAELSPGTHEVSLGFINDYYDGTPETDRNLYLDKVTITDITNLGSVTLAWDANTEEDLAGYRIHYGRTSRYDPSIDVAKAIRTGCGIPETGELTEAQKKCKESWEIYCTLGNPDPPDPLCDPDYVEYDKVIDVKNVTTFTLTDLVIGVTYYLAGTAYDEDYPRKRNHESKFSEELIHVVGELPTVRNLKKVPPAKGGK